MSVLLGVDVGGTFTDAVLAAEGRVFTAKAPSTPDDQSRGVLDAVGAVLERAGRTAEEVDRFSHGMTVTTNALLEGRAARAALIATEGFSDLVELGRQNRPELYRLCAARPAPLIPPDRRFEAPERMGPGGVLRALSREDAEALVDRVLATDPEAVAVVLLHSTRHPAHERLIGEVLAERTRRRRSERGDAAPVSVHSSHEAVGTFREYERAATTEIDAALSPLLSGYLRRLAARCAEAELPEPAIMQSSGGLITLEDAAAHAAWTVLSGPAAGAAGAAFAARAAGVEDVLCFDMGGTSCDVCVVDRGTVAERGGGDIGGRHVALPMLDVHTVGAGGGSIAWRDPGGALRVGPRSAGAVPGPACYGRGGSEPTVTDANLVLGHLDAGVPLAGGVHLDAEAAREAVARLARSLDLGLEECAAGIRRVACAEMAAALRVVTVNRGVDPRGYALMAFGGAGGLHATDIADELGIDRVLVPAAGGVLAALGLVVAPQRRDGQLSVFLSGEGLSAAAVQEQVDELGRRARERLGDPDAELHVVHELRYAGQSFELAVEARPEELREAFEAEHERRYGYRDAGAPLELVTIRVTAVAPSPVVQLGGAGSGGELLEGPRLVRLAESTVLVPAGWRGRADPSGTIHLERWTRSNCS